MPPHSICAVGTSLARPVCTAHIVCVQQTIILHIFPLENASLGCADEQGSSLQLSGKLFLHNADQLQDHPDQERDDDNDHAGDAQIPVALLDERQQAELRDGKGRERAGQRVLKKSTGKSFTEITQSIRMEEAARLLRRTRDPVSKIAQELGYANLGNFRKLFRKRYGMSPAEYRRVPGAARAASAEAAPG